MSHKGLLSTLNMATIAYAQNASFINRHTSKMASVPIAQ